MKKVTAILIGAGQRGADAYGSYALAHPDEFQVTAVAEPNAERRRAFQLQHGIPNSRSFSDWREILSIPKMADCAMICTQDRMHFEPVTQALANGYHVLCEKPMSPYKEEIIAMGRAAKEYGRILSICHVLRYSPFFIKLRELLRRGAIGRLISIQHIESVGYYHQAHSFVRGNWRNSGETSPMILQKSCHDMDILLWLADARCERISSFGSLSWFTAKNAPKGAPDRCLDGCAHRDECPYYAPRFYLNFEQRGPNGFSRAVSLDPSTEALLAALKKGPYGRCVYRCDNDVVDNQVVNISFTNGVTACFTMCAFTQKCERVINLMGSTGQLRGNMERGEITLDEFAGGTRETISLHTTEGGHSGSDERMMRDFVALVASDGNLPSKTGADLSVESHLMALAAEESRLTGKVVSMAAFGCPALKR